MKPIPTIVREFDAIADAIAADARPGVLSPTERFLLRQVPASARRALDVGCGDGTLSRALAERRIATLGIDASPRMIALARARAGASPLLEYRVADISDAAPTASDFDVVVSVAMAHHLQLPRVIEYMRAAVAPGGTVIVQDVTMRRGVRHLPANALAWLARRVRRLRGRDGHRPDVDALYAAHGAGEQYLDQDAVADVYRPLLPGARVYLHLEWRYTVVWREARQSRAS
jgi:SAM-dependent methyltransferase